MRGAIAEFLSSPLSGDTELKKLFGPAFQSLEDWKTFIRQGLSLNSVTNQMCSHRWDVKTFQALYVACWVHNPVEKGTFMIQIPDGCAARVQTAITECCTKRKSSHLSGKGYSASKGWNFLKHYHELLVQFEKTGNQYFLFLKAEGHTTNTSAIVPHAASWAHKEVYGYGKTASPELHKLASEKPDLVSSRSAENYAKGYKALLKEVLGLSGKKVLVHEMLDKLYKVTGFCHCTSVSVITKVSVASTSFELGRSLEEFCKAASRAGPYRMAGKITEDMIKDLEAIAKTLMKDPPDKLTPRVYEEIRTTPYELDSSINYFLAYQPVALLY